MGGQSITKDASFNSLEIIEGGVGRAIHESGEWFSRIITRTFRRSSSHSHFSVLICDVKTLQTEGVAEK